jgi:hypothetical protein
MPQYSEAAVAAKVRRAVLAFTTLVVTDKMLRAPLTSPFSTKHNDPVSPLLRLPAELRNQIYEYALTSTEPLAFSRRKSPLKKKKRRNGIQLSSGAPPGLALLYVFGCAIALAQINAELSLSYALSRTSTKNSISCVSSMRIS